MKKSLGAKTLVYPKPAWVVATYDKEGKANAMTVAWAGICCSDPAAVTVSLRKATYTYGNIMERKAFTLNVPSESYVKEVDFVGIVSGKATDKFAYTGLNSVRSDLVDAPYIKEFPLILECKLIHTFEIGLHTQFIGQILDVKVDEDLIGANDIPDVKKIKPIVYSNGVYYGLGNPIGKAFSVGKNMAPPI
ncbi:MAG TPA: flavin reductase family protein [Syntrophomonadaceae bacterium]|nr:flavin reductase family protein [Syntrophomonadaceae bacterium]